MFEELVQRLQMVLQGELPGSIAHQKMLPKGRSLGIPEVESHAVKVSGVLFLLFQDEGKIYTCLIKRPQSMTHHPGQIGFPGGKLEEVDQTAEDAAYREAEEEIGIDIRKIKLLGKLSDLYVSVSQFSIQTFLAWSDTKPDFVLNSNEVERLILFPVSDYIGNNPILQTQIMTSSGLTNVPCFQFNEDVIWGATAMIISEFIEIARMNKINFQAHFYNADKS